MMTNLMLALWGLLLATVVGLAIYATQRHRAERQFNQHAVQAINLTRRPR